MPSASAPPARPTPSCRSGSPSPSSRRVCGWLYYVLAFKPGGQPIGSLDKVFTNIAGRIVRLVRRRQNWRDDALSAG